MRCIEVRAAPGPLYQQKDGARFDGRLRCELPLHHEGNHLATVSEFCFTTAPYRGPYYDTVIGWKRK